MTGLQKERIRLGSRGAALVGLLLLLAGPASGQIPPAGSSAGFRAGINAANESGNAALMDKVLDHSVQISFDTLNRPGQSRHDGNGNGQIVVNVGLSPADTTAVILHEFHHVVSGDDPQNESEALCDEAAAAESTATGVIDASTNPSINPPFVISCEIKQGILDQYVRGGWACTGLQGPPPPTSPSALGPLFAELPCE